MADRKKKAPPAPPAKKLNGSTELDLTNASTPQQVGFKAMMIYMDTPGLSLRELWRTRRMGDDDTAPYFRECISWYTLERLSINGRWAKRRDEHWRAVEKRVLTALQTSAVERELDELKAMEGVESVLMQHIHGVTDEHGNVQVAAVKPKTLEGAVGALVKLGQYRDKKRERVQEDIASRAVMQDDDGESATVTVNNAPEIVDAMNEDEIEAMAIALARKRAGLPPLIEAEDDDGEE